jgi:glutamyl-tRNA reductase
VNASDPAVFLTLRLGALLLYGTTRTLSHAQDKLESYLDQARKILLLFGRQLESQKAGETEINDGVKAAFERIHDGLQQRKIELRGKAWSSLCEVVLHIAKRVRRTAWR